MEHHQLIFVEPFGLEGVVKVHYNSPSILWQLKCTLVHFSMPKCTLVHFSIFRVNVK
jgi:hypothetical protein